VKLRNLIGVIAGLLFVASAFVPLSAYHFEGEANIVGVLWNFMLPTGWFSIIAGAALIFHEKIGLKNKWLAYALFVASLLLIVLFLLEDVDYFLGLWHGVKGDFDVEGRWLLTPVSLYLGATGVLTSSALMVTRNNSAKPVHSSVSQKP
jgi:hypothetical protein